MEQKSKNQNDEIKISLFDILEGFMLLGIVVGFLKAWEVTELWQQLLLISYLLIICYLLVFRPYRKGGKEEHGKEPREISQA